MDIHSQIKDVFVEVDLTFFVFVVSLECSDHTSSSDCFLKETWSFFMLLVKIIDDIVWRFPNTQVQFIEDEEKSQN